MDIPLTQPVKGEVALPYHLQELAKEAGYYDEDNDSPYLKLFDSLYHSGGTLSFKENGDRPLRIKYWRWVSMFMRSNHLVGFNDRRAVSAFIFSFIVEPDLEEWHHLSAS